MENTTANYVAKKSAWSVVTFWSVLACILIIPIAILICRIIAVKKYTMEFYDDKIIIREGLINTHKKQITFMGITGVSVDKGLKGQIFGYGTVHIDCVGKKWDLNEVVGIKAPEKLEAYLQEKIVQVPMSNQIVGL